MTMSATTAKQPVVGVIGGMGPEATIDLMRRVLRRDARRGRHRPHPHAGRQQFQGAIAHQGADREDRRGSDARAHRYGAGAADASGADFLVIPATRRTTICRRSRRR